jgi:hypothetical protein
MSYTLSDHVYLAIADGDVVLLDATNDRYACIAACDAGSIRAGAANQRWEAGEMELELLSSGYFTRATAVSRPAPARPPMPVADLHSLGLGPSPISKADVTDALISGVVSAARLLTQRPSRWITSPPIPGKGSDASIAETRRFVEARLFVPRLSRCLPNSLALLHFLRRRNCSGQLVFGVRTHPFEAHCWVQTGTTVLNDTLDHVLWYTPIAWN